MYKLLIGVLRFDWNEAKNEANIRKHGIPFNEAAGAFRDRHSLFYFDAEHSEEEDRYILIGMSAKLNVIIVSHCWLDSLTVRIISARKATTHEKNEYQRHHAS